MDQLYRISAMMLNEWKLPLNVAICLHLLVLLGALYLPELLKSKPKFADITTVSIINVTEPAAVATPPRPRVTKQQPTPPPATSQKIKANPVKAAPIAKPQAEKIPEVQPVSKQPISLKPLEKKKIQNIKPDPTKAINLEKERQKRQRLAEALKEEELLAEQAKLAQQALEAERQLLQTELTKTTTAAKPSVDSGNQSSRPTATNMTPGSSSTLLESQYFAEVTNRLLQFWAIPDYLSQNQNLTAVVVITINQDGKIANMFFESKSGDRVFDQFVVKTIDAADPLPPIPPALKKQRFEFGIRFKPDSIQ